MDALCTAAVAPGAALEAREAAALVVGKVGWVRVAVALGAASAAGALPVAVRAIEVGRRGGASMEMVI